MVYQRKQQGRIMKNRTLQITAPCKEVMIKIMFEIQKFYFSRFLSKLYFSRHVSMTRPSPFWLLLFNLRLCAVQELFHMSYFWDSCDFQLPKKYLMSHCSLPCLINYIYCYISRTIHFQQLTSWSDAVFIVKNNLEFYSSLVIFFSFIPHNRPPEDGIESKSCAKIWEKLCKLRKSYNHKQNINGI